MSMSWKVGLVNPSRKCALLNRAILHREMDGSTTYDFAARLIKLETGKAFSIDHIDKPMVCRLR